MAIDVFWQTERGEIIEQSPTPFTVWRYIDDLNEIQETCLVSIDEYGDTTFNRLQLPLLIQELQSLAPKSKDAAARESLEKLISFVRKAEDRIHTYITFVGD